MDYAATNIPTRPVSERHRRWLHETHRLRSTTRRRLGAKGGFILWRGPSAFTGREVIVTASNIVTPPQNRELGDVLQLAVLAVDVSPMELVRAGDDATTCGSCPQRPSLGGGCFVSVPHGPQRTWYAATGAGEPGTTLGEPYPDAGDDLSFLGIKRVRMTSWGDVAAVDDPDFWRRVREACRVKPLAYTHEWAGLDPDPEDGWGWCMASCETDDEADEAERRGWRVFHERLEGEAMRPGEIQCHKAAESPHHGNLTCETCGLCFGGSKGPSISIVAHGSKRVRAELAMLRSRHQLAGTPPIELPPRLYRFASTETLRVVGHPVRGWETVSCRECLRPYTRPRFGGNPRRRCDTCAGRS